MLFAIVQNNAVVQTIRVGKPFSYNGTDYSSKWSIKLSQDQKNDLGIQEVVYGPRADERFYWVTETGVSMVNGAPTMTYTATAKDLEQLKKQFIAQSKEQANSELAQTDWMVIRKVERNVDIPENVAAKRLQIVQECADKEQRITASSNIDELIEAIKPSQTVVTDSATLDFSMPSAMGA